MLRDISLLTLGVGGFLFLTMGIAAQNTVELHDELMESTSVSQVHYTGNTRTCIVCGHEYRECYDRYVRER